MNVGGDRLGFLLPTSDLAGNTLLPRFYDPSASKRLAELAPTHDLIPLGELIDRGEITVAAGDEIGKLSYGTGNIPFVRTSDIGNWELKWDPKQRVSDEVYEEFCARQGVREGDLLFVRDGTYLIGTACLVSRYDLPLLYQSHLLRFRAQPESRVSSALLLAAFASPVVRLQVRSKQFTADIIDSLGDRYRELVLPIPKDPQERAAIDAEVRSLAGARSELRETLRLLPAWAEGLTANPQDQPVAPDPTGRGNPGFHLAASAVRSNILIPRYYEPAMEQHIADLGATHEMVTLGQLVEQGVLQFSIGIQVGKINYGMGSVPFIRTSDLVNWEVKVDPKHLVSDAIYDQVRTKAKLDVQAEDIFIVFDGTYLVGDSAMVTERDTRIIYSNSIFKVRIINRDVLDPYLLLTLLNTPIVRRQIRAKQFTRDVIDTVGLRIYEVLLPIPRDPEMRAMVIDRARQAVQERADLRARVRLLGREIEGLGAGEELLDDELVG